MLRRAGHLARSLPRRGERAFASAVPEIDDDAACAPAAAPPKKKKFAPFQWDDALNLNSQLTEEERIVRDAARAYCQGELLPRVVDAARAESFDREIMREMGGLGMLGATLPSEFGGAGLGYVSYGLIAREVRGARGALPPARARGAATGLSRNSRNPPARLSHDRRSRRSTRATARRCRCSRAS